MVTTYSTHDAKAKFSEVIRRVRDGETVVVSYRGDPVAEIKPVKPAKLNAEEHLNGPENRVAPIRARGSKTPQEERNAVLERRGALIRAREPKKGFRPLAHRPGALKRFLDERHS